MTAALEGGEGSASRPGRTLPPGKNRYPLYRRLGGPQGRSGRGGKSRPHRDSIPGRPARSQSLYRLSKRAHTEVYTILIFQFLNYSRFLHLFQMEPTRCTLLLGIFISTSLHVSANYVPIISRTYCIYATLIVFTVYGWLSGLH